MFHLQFLIHFSEILKTSPLHFFVKFDVILRIRLPLTLTLRGRLAAIVDDDAVKRRDIIYVFMKSYSAPFVSNFFNRRDVISCTTLCTIFILGINLDLP